jgi:hypothetical protein
MTEIPFGLQATNILCSVTIKENLYLLSEVVTRVNISFKKVNNDIQVTFVSSDSELQLLPNVTAKM